MSHRAPHDVKVRVRPIPPTGASIRPLTILSRAVPRVKSALVAPSL